MARVFLASTLHRFTGGVGEVDIEASTVRSLITQLDRTVPRPRRNSPFGYGGGYRRRDNLRRDLRGPAGGCRGPFPAGDGRRLIPIVHGCGVSVSGADADRRRGTRDRRPVIP